MRLTLVISSLGSGGAERVLSTMANYWAAHGHGVTLITLDSSDSDFYPLLPQVQRVGLGLMRESAGFCSAIQNNVARLSALRRSIRRSMPDAVISFMDRMNILTLLATRGLETRVLVSERTNPAKHDCDRFCSIMRRMTYPWADRVVCQTDSARQWLDREIGRAFLTVIPNPIGLFNTKSLKDISPGEVSGKSDSESTVVAMGRFSIEKGFDLLIRAFAGSVNSNPGWRLVILGDGPQRDYLVELARRLQVEKKVYFPGIIHQPFSLLRQADIFVLPSRYEGFPNALLEAMACGLPVVSFDCPSGPSDIICHGVDGLLVAPGDIDALTDVLGKLMEDGALRRRLASRAVEVTTRFGLNRVMGMWESLLKPQIRRPYHGRP